MYFLQSIAITDNYLLVMADDTEFMRCSFCTAEGKRAKMDDLMFHSSNKICCIKTLCVFL